MYAHGLHLFIVQQAGHTAAAAAVDYVLLQDLSQEQVVALVTNLTLSGLVAPFQTLRMDGSSLYEFIKTDQDLIDLDKEIKPFFARKFFKELTAWKNNGGQVPKKLLVVEESSSPVRNKLISEDLAFPIEYFPF